MEPTYRKNIRIDPAFPDRIRALRTALHLTKSELGDRSGLSIRTIQDIEAGRKSRVQENTIFSLATALDVAVSTLIGGNADDPDPLVDAPVTTRHRPRWFAPLAVFVAAVVMIAGGVLLWNWSRINATWALEDHILVVKEALLGTTLWESAGVANVKRCIDSPWDSRHILVGLGSRAPDGGRVLCLDRASADTIWAVGPDVDAIERAFGPRIVRTSNFSSHLILTADLDGDGGDELVVGFIHGLYYPFAVCVIDRHGNRESQYANWGHIYHLVVEDLENDGCDEIIGFGTNNCPEYNGATVFILDDDHRNGASVDPVATPWESAVDSARVRLVVPKYPQPFMDELGLTRLAATAPKIYKGPDDESLISVYIGDGKHHNVVLQLDAELRPLGCTPEDSFTEMIRSTWPDSLHNSTGPLDPAWLAEWLANHRRFEAGHWPLID